MHVTAVHFEFDQVTGLEIGTECHHPGNQAGSLAAELSVEIRTKHSHGIKCFRFPLGAQEYMSLMNAVARTQQSVDDQHLVRPAGIDIYVFLAGSRSEAARAQRYYNLFHIRQNL